ncbi:septum formation initiator family protein [Belnapia sp. T6]|uniref:Septum formation initiator family protein n=1 Tax=Belnapia mucosa TaxID=2804532 RepID=A0ABS1UZK8_9PROT|nr:septum formation initiator family protein [Belnapia mucosa]MBL6454447.1 septum formation initiator family protein [Belnapia mucosa]
MSFGRAVKRKLAEALPPVGLALLCGYFVWHSLHGDSGLLARERRMEEIAAARQTLVRAEAERDAMERRVNGLRGDRIDRDQLDERARTLLNLVGKDEIVIPYEPNRRLY